MNYINKGSDYKLMKALSKQGLVQKEVQIKGKNGVFTRKQWVSLDNHSNDKSNVSKKSVDKKPKTLFLPKSDCGNTRTRVFTYSDILTYFQRNKSSSNESLREFISKNYFVSDGKTQTSNLYKTNGKYTKERRKLHDKLVKEIVDSANSPMGDDPPIAVLMGGGTASGKGAIRKTKVLPTFQSQNIQLGVSDCDDIKERLPEYSPFKSQDGTTAAYRVHEESMDIALEALDKLIKNNKNLMFDSTMKDLNKMSGIISKLKSAGYRIEIVGATVPTEVAIERSEKRNQETGRKVPDYVIQSSHGKFSSVYPELLSKVDGYHLYDNTSYPPVLVQDTSNTYRPDLYESFLKKGTAYNNTIKLKELSKLYNASYSNLENLYNNGVSLLEIEDYLESGLYEED